MVQQCLIALLTIGEDVVSGRIFVIGKAGEADLDYAALHEHYFVDERVLFDNDRIFCITLFEQPGLQAAVEAEQKVRVESMVL